MSDAVTRAVASCRLAEPGPRTQRFTVDKIEALSRQRAFATERWGWSLHVVRGLLSLTDGARVRLDQLFPGDQQVVRITMWFDQSALVGLVPRPLFEAAVDPGEGTASGRLDHRQRRFWHLLARGVNEGLAAKPGHVDVRVGTFACRIVPDSAVPGGWREISSAPLAAMEIDPLSSAQGPALTIDFMTSVGADAFERLLYGNYGIVGLLALWQKRLPGLVVEDTTMVLRPFPPERCFQLGESARWWPRPDLGHIALIRDGVAFSTGLGRALAQHRVAIGEFAGVADVPRIRLTYDETSVVQDEGVSLLAAWFHDVHVHAKRGPQRPAPLDWANPSAAWLPGYIIGASWPTSLHEVWTVDGRAVPLAMLAAYANAGHPATFVWRHEADTAPEELRATTLALWPSEHELLRRAVPGLELVPLANAQVASGHASDWRTLIQGSLPELALCVVPRSSGVPLRIDVVAYIHRGGAGELGSIMLVSDADVIGGTTDLALAIPGVALVGRTSLLDARQVTTQAVLTAALVAIANAARGDLDGLIAHARATALADAPPPPFLARAEAGQIARSVEAEIGRGTVGRTTQPIAAVPVTGASFTGVIELHADGEPSHLEVAVGHGSTEVVVLDGPWSGAAGRIAIDESAPKIAPADVARAAMCQLLPRVIHTLLVLPSDAPSRPRLEALAAACREAEIMPGAATRSAPKECNLRAVLVHALAPTLSLTTDAIVPSVTWRIVSYTTAPPRLELGAYRVWISRGLNVPRDAADVGVAAGLIIASLDAASHDEALLAVLHCALHWS